MCVCVRVYMRAYRFVCCDGNGLGGAQSRVRARVQRCFEFFATIAHKRTSNTKRKFCFIYSRTHDRHHSGRARTSATLAVRGVRVSLQIRLRRAAVVSCEASRRHQSSVHATRRHARARHWCELCVFLFFSRMLIRSLNFIRFLFFVLFCLRSDFAYCARRR